MRGRDRSDLIYVPSATVLLNGDNPTDVKKLKEPGVFLIVSDTDSSYSILYEGSRWLVNKRQAYIVEEGMRL
tara:strand:+ start:11618 stop:11833 length:216 start_codon:yes stop_codon:yes gene_type:complete